MKKLKVLFVSQEIKPFLPDSEIASSVRKLAQKTQENGKEIRVFTPRFGSISERRHQLHEVIRLSGMNLVIDDVDHPLIIKVASVPSARMQVYFIDNDDFFQRKTTTVDKEGNFYEDNDERSMFFCRGVLETVKKLGWIPDVVHCHGWMTSLMPVYLKEVFKDDPHFADSKVVYSTYETSFDGNLDTNLSTKLVKEGVKDVDLSLIANPTKENLDKFAIQNSDAVIQSSENTSQELQNFIDEQKKLVQPYVDVDTDSKTISEFYDKVVEDSSVLCD